VHGTLCTGLHLSKHAGKQYSAGCGPLQALDGCACSRARQAGRTPSPSSRRRAGAAPASRPAPARARCRPCCAPRCGAGGSGARFRLAIGQGKRHLLRLSMSSVGPDPRQCIRRRPVHKKTVAHPVVDACSLQASGAPARRAPRDWCACALTTLGGMVTSCPHPCTRKGYGCQEAAYARQQP